MISTCVKVIGYFWSGLGGRDAALRSPFALFRPSISLINGEPLEYVLEAQQTAVKHALAVKSPQRKANRIIISQIKYGKYQMH